MGVGSSPAGHKLKIMTLQRIILTVPFMRHYAGSVFELYENPTPEGWDDNEP
jgi:hypothetical protein